MQIPDGYCFAPTDEQLVLNYLLKKAKGEALSSEAVTDREIYGDNDKEPWKLFGETSCEKFYIFTKLKKKAKGKRVERKAGCGTWKGQRTDPVKDSHNNQVGFKKLFVFEVKGSGSNNANNGHWLMHEFSLLNDESDYVLCAIRNKHAIDYQPKHKRVRFSSSLEEEQNSVFGSVATPVSTLASDEALSYAATYSNSFIETAKPVSTLATDEALGFATGSKNFIGEATPIYSVSLDQVLGNAASNCNGGFTAEELEHSGKELMPENFARDLLGAEDAKQVQNLKESVQATNAQELRKRSLQQQSMVRFSNNYAMEDMLTSFTTAAESVFTSASALAFNAGILALDFDAGFSDCDLPFWEDLL